MPIEGIGSPCRVWSSARIQAIEQEELEHRRLVGEMLTELKVVPNKARERRAAVVGRVLGFLCHVGGWLAPMYGAGKLERRNIGEYEAAARFAMGCGRGEWVDSLLTMAEVEWEHEQYFRAQVLGHWLGRRIPIWPAPAAKETIRGAIQSAQAPGNRPGPGESAGEEAGGALH